MEYKCKICGGNLDIKKIQRIVECPYCGVQQTLPNTEDTIISNLYDRANHFFRNNDYDKAESMYEEILNRDLSDAEAYWSLLMCKFGVEYVKDPKTNQYIPTCNRTQKSSIFSDENYKKAIEYSDDLQQELYKKQAETINTIQKGILEISKKEQPYDVFICYKEKDNHGERTIDSVLAQDLYSKLVSEGLRVFFARITLEDKLGTEYEPYIYAALNSAKVMIVIGTNRDYLEAPWVRNEWSRYLSIMKHDKEKTLIPCYKDMDAYDLPEEFAHIQAQDMNKIGFMQDLIRGIKKIVPIEEQSDSANSIQKGDEKILSSSEKEEIYNQNIQNFQKVQETRVLNHMEKMKIYKDIIVDLKKLGNYKDSGIIIDKCNKLYLQEKLLQTQKAIKECLISIFSFFIIFIVVLNVWILPKKEYDEKKRQYDIAMEQYNKGKYYEALQSLNLIVEFENSMDKMEEIKLDWRKSNAKICFADMYNGQYKLFAVKQIGSITEIGTSDVEQITKVIKLKKDGTVEPTSEVYSYMAEKTKFWNNIVSLSESDDYVYGVKADGTVEFAKYQEESTNEIDISNWNNIIQIEPCLFGGVVGLRDDGTVVYNGIDKSCILAIKEWKDVVQLSGTNSFLIALKKDGTVEKVTCVDYYTLELQDETGVIQLSQNEYFSSNVSLIKEDGKIKTYGDNSFYQCETSGFSNIAYVYCDGNGVYGVKKDGHVLIAGKYAYNEAVYWSGIKVNSEWRSVK